jgi:hypothetical protein
VTKHTTEFIPFRTKDIPIEATPRAVQSNCDKYNFAMCDEVKASQEDVMHCSSSNRSSINKTCKHYLKKPAYNSSIV